jgi:hypothetical protein
MSLTRLKFRTCALLADGSAAGGVKRVHSRSLRVLAFCPRASTFAIWCNTRRHRHSHPPVTLYRHSRSLQDYRVHIKHTDGRFEYIPYFCLPANDLNDVIADSCYSCFDYPNALADLVVGYMAVPWQKVDMTSHMQVVTVRLRVRARMLFAWWSRCARACMKPHLPGGDGATATTWWVNHVQVVMAYVQACLQHLQVKL